MSFSNGPKRLVLTLVLVALSAAAPSLVSAQTPLEITPERLKVECMNNIRQLHPDQTEAWWDEKCVCFAETSTQKMLDFLAQTGRRETSRIWSPRKTEAYLECEIVV